MHPRMIRTSLAACLVLCALAPVGVGAQALPGPPQNLTGSVSGSWITLSWQAPAGGIPVTGYVLDFGVSPGEYLASAPVGELTSIAASVPAGFYVFRVHAENDVGIGPPTPEVALNVNGPAGPPSAPRNLVATVVNNVVTLRWDAPGTGAPLLTYYLSGTEAGRVWKDYSPGLATEFSYPLPPNRVYTVAVTAVNAVGDGPAASVTFASGPAAPLQLPSAPRNLTASAVGSQLLVQWDEPATGAPITDYVLSVSGPGIPLTQVSLGLVTAIPGVDVPDGVYQFAVAAVNARGEGPPTAAVSVTVDHFTPPGAPLQLTGDGAHHTLALAWHPPATGVPSRGYDLQVGSAPGDYGLFSGGIGNATSIASYAAEGTYYSRVRAANDAGPGPFTPEIAVTVGPPCARPAAPVLSASLVGGAITLSWTPAAGLAPTGYTLQLGAAVPGTYSSTVVGQITSLSGVVGSGRYRMRVLASVACGLSDPSNEVTITVP